MDVVKIRARRRHALPATAILGGLLGLGLLSSGAATAAAPAATMDPVQWSEGLCSDITRFGEAGEEFQSYVNSVVPANIGGESEAKEARTAFVAGLKDLGKLSRSIAKNGKKAGHPDVANGEKIAGGFIRGFELAGKAFDRAATDAKAVPVDSQEKFEKGFTALAKNITKSFAPIESEFTKAGKLDKDGELGEAFAQAPSCVALNG